jgi:hypothetical protein
MEKGKKPMQIVIDIPEYYYKAIKEIPVEQSTADMMSIRKGTPLPKGHGRLIDADAFIETLEDASKRHKYKELLFDDYLTVDDVFKAVIESLQNRGLAEDDAPTIIEADKDESEET